MQKEDKNVKKMPTTFGKESEQLEHAIDRVLVVISERRTARSLHGISEQPPHSILTATLELVNMVKMILNILERPPFDCMSEFSSLKSHLIKHITLLKHFSEQLQFFTCYGRGYVQPLLLSLIIMEFALKMPDLTHEMESDIIDVCKGVTKMCHYIIALPPDLPIPERLMPGSITGEVEQRPSKVEVPPSTEPEIMSSSVEPEPAPAPEPKPEPKYIPLLQRLSMPITTTISSHGPAPPLEYVSHPNQTVSESYSSERIQTASNEHVTLGHYKGSKSEAEVSDTKCSEHLSGSLYHKSLQDLTAIEYTPLTDSGSERGIMDSESDRGIVSDFEQHSKDSGSVIWGMDSDSEKSTRDSSSTKQPLEAENCQMDSVSAENLIETEQQLVRIEQCPEDAEFQKQSMHSDSEKFFEDSDSENFLDSDNERLGGIDSDSDKYPTDSASVKYMLKEEKRQMASDSVKRLMESEQKIMETENFWLFPDSEKYAADSDTETDRLYSASTSQLHPMQEEKWEMRSKRYVDYDSDPYEMDSDSERYQLASEAVKCLLDTELFKLNMGTDSFWKDSMSERKTVNSDSESPDMIGSVKLMRKADTCQSTCDLDKLWMSDNPESLRDRVEFKRKHLDCSRKWNSSRSDQLQDLEPQDGFGRCQSDLQNLPANFERNQADSNSETQQKNTGNERHQNESESENYLVKMESEFENEICQMTEERERHLVESDSKKENKITTGDETCHLSSENEAERLGARKKDNRPPGFWMPIPLHLSSGQGKKAKEQHSIQYIDDKFSRSQLTRNTSDDKTVRFKEVSPTLSDKKEKKKLKERYSHSLSPDSTAFIDDKQHRKISRKTFVYKHHYKEGRYAHSSHSYGPQISPINLSPEDYTSNISAPVCSPTASPQPVVRRKTRSTIYPWDIGTQRCSRCFMEISNSTLHKCPMSSDDSDSECPQVSLDSKHSLSSKTIRHHKTSRNNPLSRSLDPKHPVGIRCPLHQEDYKFSLSSTSQLYCESCSALQNLMGSTVTYTFPKKSENASQHTTHGHIGFTPVTLLESKEKLNLIAKHQNTNSTENETKLVRDRNLQDEADSKDKPLSEDESGHKDESSSENEADAEDETDTEDEDDTKEKKDPKDKPDPDDSNPDDGNCGSDPKDKSDPDDSNPDDGNCGNDTDANNGSDHCSDSGHTSGSHSKSDDDSKSGSDPNSEGDTKSGTHHNSDSDNATTNNVNLNYTIKDDICTNNSDSASGFADAISQDNTADFKSGTIPSYTSGTQNKTVLDYTSASPNGADPRNATGLINDTCPKNIRSTPNSLGPRNNGIDPNNNFSPRKNNYNPQKDPESHYNTKLSNTTRHSTISTASHNHTAAPKYYSHLNYDPGFTHKTRSSFEVNPNYFDRTIYARPSSAASPINATNTSNTICGSGAISARFTPGKICASDNKHITRFLHFNSFKIIINPNYNDTNMHNAHDSNSNSNISNLHTLGLESSSNYSTPNYFYCFLDGTNYNFAPDYVIIMKFYCSPELGRDYTVFDGKNFGAQFKESAGFMDSATSKYATGSKGALDANEPGFLIDFSRILNSIGIKDPSILKIISNPDIHFPSLDVIVEAEPHVVKFAISSGAVNHFFKLFDNDNGALGAEGESLGEPVRAVTRRSEVPVWRSEEGSAWGPEGGLPITSKGRYVANSARDIDVRPGPGLVVKSARSCSVSPAGAHAENHGRERAVSVPRGYVAKQAIQRTVSPSRMPALTPAQGLALVPARRYEKKHLVGSAVGLTVKPAERYAEETSRSAKHSTKSTSDKRQKERRLQVSTVFINFFMKAKAQNWLDLSWFKRVLPSLFSEEDRYVWSSTRFCAIACTELGHGKCEGWLWHKRASRGISFFSWKKYWFILNHSTLYWFSRLNDTKADGFIYLPEFRIDLATHCRRHHAFQATHARIKDFYFSATCSDEMNYWVGQLLELAYGSSFGDAAANAEYRRMGAMVYAKCVMALKREFPVVWCNNCQEATTIVSVKPNFQYRRAQNASDEFIYFRPIDVEKARRQKQKPAMASHQSTREGIHQRDLGSISQVVLVTTPALTKELESSALVRPKTSGLLRLEQIPVNSPGVPDSLRLDVTGIASPEERGKGTAVLVAGVPGKEELDDTEIPTLKFTGFIHLEALINKCSPSSEYSRPRSPRNLWLESPENAESPGSDDLEVARSMYPFRERSVFRRSWAELIEAPLNSEGLHILQTTPTEEENEIGYLQLEQEEENVATTPPRDQQIQALQGPFPLLPQRPKLQRQRSRSLPRFDDARIQRGNAPSFTLNSEQKHIFFPSDHDALTGVNTKERSNMEETWQRANLAPSGENLPHNPIFKNSAMHGNTEIPEDNGGRPRGNGRITNYNVSRIPTVNVGVPMANPEAIWGNGRVTVGNFEVLGGSGGVPRRSGFGIPVGNLKTLGHSVRVSRHIVTSPLIELSKIGEHQL